MLLYLRLGDVALWIWTIWSDSYFGGGFGSQSTFSSPLEDTGQLIGQPNGRQGKKRNSFFPGLTLTLILFHTAVNYLGNGKPSTFKSLVMILHGEGAVDMGRVGMLFRRTLLG